MVITPGPENNQNQPNNGADLSGQPIQSDKNSNNLTFWLVVALSGCLIVLMMAEVHYIFSHKADIKTDNNSTSSVDSKTIECNTDIKTWKSYSYEKGDVSISFKYPSCWQPDTNQRADRYSPEKSFLSSSIDLSYQDSNKLYQGTREETEEKQLSSFTLEAGYYAAINDPISKVAERTNIGKYPATKTIYMGTRNKDVNILVQADTGLQYKPLDQIGTENLNIGFRIEYYQTDKTDYSRIADLIGSTFEIKQ